MHWHIADEELHSTETLTTYDLRESKTSYNESRLSKGTDTFSARDKKEEPGVSEAKRESLLAPCMGMCREYMTGNQERGPICPTTM